MHACLCVRVQEGNLRRYPTPYPDELKNMVKTAQSVAHRLKEDESGDEMAGERNHIGVQSVGVKVSAHTDTGGRSLLANTLAFTLHKHQLINTERINNVNNINNDIKQKLCVKNLCSCSVMYLCIY